jgi:hypothetical protein
MRKIITGIVISLIFQFNLSAQKILIDNLIDSLSDKRIILNELKGEFNFYKSDYKLNIFKSEILFSDKKSNGLLNIYYSTVDSKDVLIINKKSYKLKNPYDVKSCKLYNLNYKDKEMLCLVGKSPSASGSGVQLTFYTLFSKENNMYRLENEFSTRFGNIHNLGDFNNDGRLELISIKRVNENFNLFISSLNGVNLEMGFLQLNYNGNNEFTVVNNQLKIPLH